MENTIHILIIIHAVFGGIALLTGFVSLITTKGNSVHKKFGKVFFYSMLVSAAIGILIANLPKHESPFLITIGIFSSYFVLSGYRALRYKKDASNLKLDKFISWTMILTGIVMIVYPLILSGSINIILTVFGLLGLTFGVFDIRLYQQPEKLKKGWLKLHLGKMMGGYISATTAFIVVNNFIPGLYGWFVPGLIGGIYIAYWMRRLNTKSIVK